MAPVAVVVARLKEACGGDDMAAAWICGDHSRVHQLITERISKWADDTVSKFHFSVSVPCRSQPGCLSRIVVIVDEQDVRGLREGLVRIMGSDYEIGESTDGNNKIGWQKKLEH